MAFHTLVYGDNGSGTAPQPYPRFAGLPIVPDPTISTANGHFIPSRPLHLMLAAAGGDDLVMARVTAPSLRPFGSAGIHPINTVETLNSTGGLHVMTLLSHPLLLNAQEEVGIEVSYSDQVVPDDGSAAVCWVTDGLEALPHGESYWIGFTALKIAVAPNSPIWQQLQVTYDQTLPGGTYAVIGMEIVAANVIATRLIFDGQIDRPGVTAIAEAGTRQPSVFYDGTLGVWGKYQPYAPPKVEAVLRGDAAVEASDYRGFLRVVRLAG